MNGQVVEEKLVLRNQFDELGRLSEWVSEVTTRLDVTSRTAFQLDLVLTEAVTNIIGHGFMDEEVQEIWLLLRYAPPILTVVLQDKGQAFDPLEQPEVDLADSLADVEIGGLGIHLIRSYTKSCTYQRLNDSNILTLTLQETGY
jgi:anti-sigma regulatory factor (Ser/Thr protein kinase)